MSIVWILGTLYNLVLSEANQDDYDVIPDQVMSQSNQWINYYACFLLSLVSRNKVQGPRHFVQLCATNALLWCCMVMNYTLIRFHTDLICGAANMCLVLMLFQSKLLGLKQHWDFGSQVISSLQLSSKFGRNGAGSSSLRIKGSKNM